MGCFSEWGNVAAGRVPQTQVRAVFACLWAYFSVAGNACLSLYVCRAMQRQQKRREFVQAALITLSGAAAAGCNGGAKPAENAPTGADAFTNRLVALETELAGRIGVFAFAPSMTRAPIAYRADERFAMCSTFKWALAAAILEQVDRGTLKLEAKVPYAETDILEHAPVTSANLDKGELSISELAQASVTVSDNTAANLLLELMGGPSALTHFFQNIGDKQTHLDRNEPLLNMNLPGDERDTTTPRAMATSFSSVLSTDILSLEGRSTLTEWLVATQTGLKRLRGGFPEHLRAGDKTGTGNGGAVSDVAVVWINPSTPIFVASYMSGSAEPLKRLEAAHREIGAFVLEHFASSTKPGADSQET